MFFLKIIYSALYFGKKIILKFVIREYYGNQPKYQIIVLIKNITKN